MTLHHYTTSMLSVIEIQSNSIAIIPRSPSPPPLSPLSPFSVHVFRPFQFRCIDVHLYNIFGELTKHFACIFWVFSSKYRKHEIILSTQNTIFVHISMICVFKDKPQNCESYQFHSNAEYEMSSSNLLGLFRMVVLIRWILISMAGVRTPL